MLPVFRCSEYEVSADETWHTTLAVDPSIDCSSTRYKAVFTVAVVFVLVSLSAFLSSSAFFSGARPRTDEPRSWPC